MILDGGPRLCKSLRVKRLEWVCEKGCCVGYVPSVI